jgi:hypothetical protein
MLNKIMLRLALLSFIMLSSNIHCVFILYVFVLSVDAEL